MNMSTNNITVVGEPGEGGSLSRVFSLSKSIIESLEVSIEYCNFYFDFQSGGVVFEVDRDDVSSALKRPGFLFLNIHLMPELEKLIGLEQLEQMKLTPVWVWEMPSVPAEWLRYLRIPERIIVPSQFVGDCFRSSGFEGQISVIPHNLDPVFSCDGKMIRDPKDGCTYGFSFSFVSGLARKNVLGLVEAYKLAFPRSSKSVRLVLKSEHGNFRPDDAHLLWRHIGERDDITLISRSLSVLEYSCWLKSLDTFVSLHRSEGFGLCIAEAMMCGVATISTGYSGNLEFQNPNNSSLVSFEMSDVGNSRTNNDPFLPGMMWAEPCINHAADLILQDADCSISRQSRADKGQYDAKFQLSIDRLMKLWFSEISLFDNK